MTTDQNQPVTDCAAVFNQDQPAVKDTAQTLSQDMPQVLNQTRALVGLPRMMMAACIVLLTINSDLYEGVYYNKVSNTNRTSKSVDLEQVGALFSLGFCILVMAFLLLCWWSFLPARKLTSFDLCLNTGIVIGGFLGGKPQKPLFLYFEFLLKYRLSTLPD